LGVWPLLGICKKKNTETHDVALRGNFSGSVSITDPVKGLKDMASLLVLHSKKNFCLGNAEFLSDVISGGLLGHLGPLYQSVKIII